jgi:CPA1 family monovalent cation:H+ antiporter
MSLTAAVTTIALLFIIVAISHPMAARLKLPVPVILALLGTALAISANWVSVNLTSDLPIIAGIATGFVELPISSDIFIYVLLPVLLFQGAVGIDVRHLAHDSIAVLLLAIIAVLLSIGMIGGALHLVVGAPLVACFLLAAIVATTDPSAVISLFRELGAPPRLTRLVEGESLLNDATAIAAYTALMGVIVSGTVFSAVDLSIQIATGFLGGIALGGAAGFALARLLERLHDFRSAQMTLTLATPYLIFVTGSTTPLISGVVAVVVAGIAIGAIGRSRLTGNGFRFLRDLLDQVADWSTGLIFIMAAMIIPRILLELQLVHILTVGTVIVAALLARAVILWGLAPILVMTGLMRPISHQMNAALLWGGLRGAMTLALVLAVSESPFIDADTKRFIALTATGYTLFTLLVQGTTLRFVVRWLGLTDLAPVDRAFRTQALSNAVSRTRDKVRALARRAGLPTEEVDEVLADYEVRLGVAGKDRSFDAITDKDKLRIGLDAMVNQERNLLLEQRWSAGLPGAVVDQYLYALDSMRDAVRDSGRSGYLSSARKPYCSTTRFRIGSFLHRRLKFQGALAAYLGRKFHMTLVSRSIVIQIDWFINKSLKPVLGSRICDILRDINARRRADLERNIEAIRLQYPTFARALEMAMISGYAHEEELLQIDALSEAGIITPDIATSLAAETRGIRRTFRIPGRIDIAAPKPELLKGLRAFEDFSDEQLKRMAKKLRPIVFADGTMIYKPGDIVDTIYFISNGAVEITREGQDPVRLGPGQAFGQLRVLNPDLKPANVRAISYSHCYKMKVHDFRAMLRDRPDWKDRMSSERISSGLAD